MREAKFRGMTTKGEMITGSLVVTDRFIKHMERCHTKTWIVESAFGNGGWFNVTRKQYVKPETVGQYTGLKDRNGVEICEGDVITDHVGVGVIVWSDKNASLKVSYLGDNNGLGKWFADYNLKGERESIEVIGNIHENHELLERE